MGFFDKLKKVGQSVYSGAKAAARWTGEKIKNGAEWVAKKMERALQKDTAPEWNPEPDNTEPVGYEEEKARVQKEANEVEQWQSKVKIKARKRERAIQNAFKNVYEPTITQLEEIFDEEIIDEIQSFIDEKSKCFKNKIRDEVNTKVSSSYGAWNDLISLPNLTKKQIQEYCDNVYNTADNNILELLKSSIDETNKHIKDVVNKYNNDRAKHQKSLKESLLRLSADETTRTAEIKSIYEKLAVILFINFESNE